MRLNKHNRSVVPFNAESRIVLREILEKEHVLCQGLASHLHYG